MIRNLDVFRAIFWQIQSGYVVLWEMTRTRFEPDARPLSDAHAKDGSRDRTHLNAPDAPERSPVSEHDRHVDPPGP